MSDRLKTATLAVGTEIVDGQVTDRNSGWISDRCVTAGIEVIEHRAVPDDRALIAQALTELSQRVDLLFVTGGLGPTSDDMTRDLISDVFKAPLEFHEPSWQKIVKRFEDRGAVAKPIQRQQCFYPRGATILDNPVGTANAFSMPVVSRGRSVFVVVLPGPPIEIAAIWQTHLAAKIEKLVPSAEHEDLEIWQTLGLGEGDIAEKVEAAIKGSGLRVGYRVHLPYVEVKLWIPRTEALSMKPLLNRIDEELKPWIAGRGKSDVADRLIHASYEGHQVAILDRVTGGYIQARLSERLAIYQKEHPGAISKGSLRVTTTLLSSSEPTPDSLHPSEGSAILLSLVPEPIEKKWLVKMTGPLLQTLAVEPTPLYGFGSERGHKYMAEKAFHLLSSLPLFSQTQKEG